MENAVRTFRPAYKRAHTRSQAPSIFYLLIISLCYLTAVTNMASAATYYCDPVDGNTATGTGAADDPWETLQSVFQAGKIQRRVYPEGAIINPDAPVEPGDILRLRTGYHGVIGEYNGWYNNEGPITIEADDGCEPRLGYIHFEGASKWIFSNLTIRPEFAGIYKQPFIFKEHSSFGSSHHVILENCDLSIASDATVSSWSRSDWDNNTRDGIQLRAADSIARNNNVYNVKYGILGGGENTIIENNTINKFTMDGLRYWGGNNLVWQYNTVKNSLVVNTNHDDGIQFYSPGNVVSGIVIRGNEFHGYADPSVPYSSPFQGMACFDGAAIVQDWTVENNLMIVYHTHGITIMNPTNSKIINNTIVLPPNVPLLAPPGLKVGSATNTVVKNNIVWDAISGSGIIKENNLENTRYNYYDVFNDYDNYDFTLKSGGPAVDIGSSLLAPSTDIEGNSRPQGSGYDIGAYEYVPSDSNNPTPELQAIGNKSVNENSLLTFDVNATDPNGDPITYSAQVLPSGATLDPQTGDFAWTPSYNQAGSYQVTFRASDGNSQDSETITITVNNVNRAPVLGAITDQSVNENSLLSFSVNATDPDGQALTYSVSGLPAGAVFASQTLTWTPGYTQAGTHQVTFAASDGTDQDSETITITVNNTNRAPVLSSIGDKSVYTENSLTFTASATDPDGDTITYSATGLPSGATFTGQDFDWTPSQGQMGSYDVTFIASDGQLQDSQMVTITVDVDSLAPNVTNSLPTAGSIQARLNTLITLHIVDAGEGVDANSPIIYVDDNIVYTSNTPHYRSEYGHCRRRGTKADYTFIYQSNDMFDFDKTMSVTVNATDLAGNAMSEHSYSFVTEMRSFGQNKQVNSGSGNLNSDRPVTIRDSSGNIWAAWHAGPIDNRDIYIGKLAAGADDFDSTVQLTNDATDQCNPAVALDSSDKLYVVWQDNRREICWDIYVSTSVDGINWSTERRVTDSNDNQINPAIAIDGLSPNQAHIVWQDDRAGNQDIYVATSSDGFVTKTVSQITSDSSDQVEPAIAADSDNTIYVVWTDGRNSSNDIYGAASNNSWINVQIVSNANNQSSPTIAAESAGSILHLLWADNTSGDNDIHYATSNGLLDCPLTGFSIIDDTTGADQLEPAIVIEGSTGNDLKVFACWQDWRNADTDLYFAELSAGSGTNVFVGDGGSSAYQSEPVIGIDEYSHPYLVWADSRNTDIYYAGSTFVEPVPLISQLAPFSKGAVYGLPVGQLRNPGDICMQIPGGAYSCEMRLEASRIKNAQRFAARQSKIPYEFSPSGIEFNVPITITIAYEPVGSPVSVYWHDPLTGTLKQDGITNVTIIEKSQDLHLVRFKVRHFTSFYLLGGGAAAAALGLGGGLGGGGCSMSPNSQGNIMQFLLPYVGLTVVMVILKLRDVGKRKARNITKSEC